MFLDSNGCHPDRRSGQFNTIMKVNHSQTKSGLVSFESMVCRVKRLMWFYIKISQICIINIYRLKQECAKKTIINYVELLNVMQLQLKFGLIWFQVKQYKAIVEMYSLVTVPILKEGWGCSTKGPYQLSVVYLVEWSLNRGFKYDAI